MRNWYQIIHTGQRQGWLTYKDLASCISEGTKTLEIVDAINICEDLGIRILSNVEAIPVAENIQKMCELRDCEDAFRLENIEQGRYRDLAEDIEEIHEAQLNVDSLNQLKDPYLKLEELQRRYGKDADGFVRLPEEEWPRNPREDKEVVNDHYKKSLGKERQTPACQNASTNKV